MSDTKNRMQKWWFMLYNRSSKPVMEIKEDGRMIVRGREIELTEEERIAIRDAFAFWFSGSGQVGF